MSAIAHSRLHGHEVTFIVIDGSETRGRETRTGVVDVARQGVADVRYVGRAEALLIRRRLQSCGLPRHVLEAALTPGEIGASRNLGLVLTSGRPVVFLDDDILCDTWSERTAGEGIRFTCRDDPHGWTFFATRREAQASLNRRPDVSVFSTLGDSLGQSLDDCFHRRGTQIGGDVCNHLVEAMAQKRGRVRVSMLGLAGDSARYCSHAVLIRPTGPPDELLKDGDALARALTFREVRRAASQMTITHDGICMSYAMGLDNETLLPPFMPVGRGEDTIFGMMLANLDDCALFGHPPYGIVHDSTRPAPFGADRMPSARQIRLCDLVGGHLESETFTGASLACRLSAAGQQIAEICEADLEALRQLAATIARRKKAARLAAMQEYVEPRTAPGHIARRAFEEYRMELAASLSKPDFYVPIEFSRSSTEDSLRAFRQFLMAFGQTLSFWPTIWQQSKDLDLLPAPVVPAAS